MGVFSYSVIRQDKIDVTWVELQLFNLSSVVVVWSMHEIQHWTKNQIQVTDEIDKLNRLLFTSILDSKQSSFASVRYIFAHFFSWKRWHCCCYPVKMDKSYSFGKEIHRKTNILVTCCFSQSWKSVFLVIVSADGKKSVCVGHGSLLPLKVGMKLLLTMLRNVQFLWCICVSRMWLALWINFICYIL